jgi:ArsR family transcriptional regulator
MLPHLLALKHPRIIHMPSGVLPPTSAAHHDFDIAMRAIAHPLRREILGWLKDPRLSFPKQAYGQDLGVCVGQIVSRCDISQSTVSSHLALLKRAGLVELIKAGSVHFLRRNETAIQLFKEELAERVLL